MVGEFFKMKSNLLFLFLFLLVLAPFISAQPPPQTQFNVNLDVGLDIDFPKITALRINEPFKFNFHVFNRSNGLRVDNSSTNCVFHLFDNKGDHIVSEMNLPFLVLDGDWEADIKRGNFSRLGQYSSLVDCNDGGFGGFVSFPLDVTADGFLEKDFPKEFSVILFGLLLIIFGLSKERYRMLKHIGGILWIIMGVITLYPGYGFINWTTLLGKVLGFILIGGGFYVWLEDSFSRDEQDAYFEQGEEKKKKEVSE